MLVDGEVAGPTRQVPPFAPMEREHPRGGEPPTSIGFTREAVTCVLGCSSVLKRPTVRGPRATTLASHQGAGPEPRSSDSVCRLRKLDVAPKGRAARAADLSDSAPLGPIGSLDRMTGDYAVGFEGAGGSDSSPPGRASSPDVPGVRVEAIALRAPAFGAREVSQGRSRPASSTARKERMRWRLTRSVVTSSLTSSAPRRYFTVASVSGTHAPRRRTRPSGWDAGVPTARPGPAARGVGERLGRWRAVHPSLDPVRPDFDFDAGSPGVQPTCQVASRPAHGHCAELLALDR